MIPKFPVQRMFPLGAAMAFVVAVTVAMADGPPQAAPQAWSRVPDILARIVPPTFPAREFSITNYGAIDDGLTDNTKAFQSAIVACAEAGGGKVVVPAGVFVTGAIHLRSNVNLHLAKDATIRFSTDPKSFLPVVFARYEC